MHQFISGQLNVPEILSTQGGETAVQMLLTALPLGKLFLAAYLFIMIIFLASHMDAVAYTMAATSTRNLQEGQDPSPMLRLFWCVVITPDPAVDPVHRRLAGHHENHGDPDRAAVPAGTASENLRLRPLAEAGLRGHSGSPDRKQRAGAARGAAGRRTLRSIVVSTAPYGEMTIRKEEG